MPVKIKAQQPAATDIPDNEAPKTKAQSVQDIFKILGDKGARQFITSRVHTLPAAMPSSEVPEYLWSLHYGYHKDMENYAMVALERFNHGRD